MHLRDATPADYAAILELNRLSVAVLSPLDLAQVRSLDAIAHGFRVIEVHEPGPRIAAFLLTLRQGAPYNSPNFLWFDQRYADFLYVDRIVVGAEYRGQGLGQRLYADLFAQAEAEGVGQIALEVDIDPPNPASLKFHQQQGFVEVGQLRPYGTKIVSLQLKTLTSRLFHIVAQVDWDTAQRQGIYRAASLESEGFIHLSRREQVIGTANRFYRGQTGLVLLEIQSDRLQSQLRYDTVPGHGTFPHLYGPLSLDAVVKVWPLESWLLMIQGGDDR